jgi:uncharacterized repeat protein (TIGR04052 family)
MKWKRTGTHQALLGLLVACAGEPGLESQPTRQALSAGEHAFALDFGLLYSGRPVGCGERISGVGLSSSTVELRDARLYIHDIRAILDDGESVNVSLEESMWQRSGVALIDFADDTGLCDTGSPDINTQVLGRYAGTGNVVGVRFRVGLPEELNHLDAARSPAPLNAPGMAWSWVDGYKYARIDVQSEGNETWFVHLGATDCEGSPVEGVHCASANIAELAIDGLVPDSPTVALDLECVYARSDVDASLAEGDHISGCMAFGGDPECPPIFSAFGINSDDDVAASSAHCFRAGGAP